MTNKKQLAVMMFVEDIPVEEIAAELEASVPTVYSWLEEFDVTAKVRSNKYDEAVRLYRDTDTPVSVICSRLHLSPPTLYHHVRARKVSLRKAVNRTNPETEQDIVELYLDRMPIKDILTLYPMAPPKLYSILRKHKVKPRRHS